MQKNLREDLRLALSPIVDRMCRTEPSFNVIAGINVWAGRLRGAITLGRARRARSSSLGCGTRFRSPGRSIRPERVEDALDQRHRIAVAVHRRYAHGVTVRDEGRIAGVADRCERREVVAHQGVGVDAGLAWIGQQIIAKPVGAMEQIA